MGDSALLVGYRGPRGLSAQDAVEIPAPRASIRANGAGLDVWSESIAAGTGCLAGRTLAVASGIACLALLRSLRARDVQIAGALFINPATLYGVEPYSPLGIPAIVLGPRSAGRTGVPPAASFSQAIGALYVEAEDAAGEVTRAWLARPYSAILLGRLAWTVELHEARLVGREATYHPRRRRERRATQQA